MAGICGIIIKRPEQFQANLQAKIEALLFGMAYSPEQGKCWKTYDNLAYGAVVQTGISVAKTQACKSSLGVDCIYEGYISISQEDKLLIEKKFQCDFTDADYNYLPYLFTLYQNDVPLHLSGCYNIFFYDKNNNSAHLFNDRLGVLPLYYYDDDNLFIFASRIEAILTTGLLPKINFDEISFAEHLLFNYIISDNTYIKQIKTLRDASLCIYKTGSISFQRYWSMREYFECEQVKDNSDFELLKSALKKSIEDILPDDAAPFNFTLTGGWDSRVILAYLLPEYRERIRTYSFGAEQAPDILIPKIIAERERFVYTPYPLTQEYLNNYFLDWAKKTITLSGGTRNYKRTHYLYVASQVAKNSGISVSGIFGDEVMKVGKPLPGEIISKEIIDWIDADFNLDVISSSLDDMEGLFKFFSTQVNFKDELLNRLSKCSMDYKDYPNIEQKYFAFRFSRNLRKYFGAEINSYNDFIITISPYINHDFLKSYASTKFAGFRYPFKTGSLQRKRQTTLLYYQLINAAYSPLLGYNSSRGYSIKDAVSLFGKLNIIYKKYLRKGKTIVDGFNTTPTDNIFYNELMMNNKKNSLFLYPLNPTDNSKFVCNYNSLYYWASEIENKYNL
ncbi:MAG TPA: asparagine synthase-related protein [Candidatus Cloacimonadota bacterium]|nr:asparagine synthase-related protein [Candidatus Cloacimonadota bacterium]